jgi:hypothetical protein
MTDDSPAQGARNHPELDLTPAKDGHDAASEAARRAGGTVAVPEARRTRPPLWLIVLTLAIPLTVGMIWWGNWYGRELSGEQIRAYLSGSNPSEHMHALDQFYEKSVKFAAEPKNSDVWKYLRDELSGSADAVLLFAGKDSAREQVNEAMARTLGRFGKLAEVDAASFAEPSRQARSRLEDVMISARQQGKKVVRYQAACALSLYHDEQPEVVNSLREMLQESDARYRLNAASALCWVGSSIVADDLKKAADTDPDPMVRQAAKEAYQIALGRQPAVQPAP